MGQKEGRHLVKNQLLAGEQHGGSTGFRLTLWRALPSGPRPHPGVNLLAGEFAPTGLTAKLFILGRDREGSS